MRNQWVEARTLGLTGTLLSGVPPRTASSAICTPPHDSSIGPCGIIPWLPASPWPLPRQPWGSPVKDRLHGILTTAQLAHEGCYQRQMRQVKASFTNFILKAHARPFSGSQVPFQVSFQKLPSLHSSSCLSRTTVTRYAQEKLRSSSALTRFSRVASPHTHQRITRVSTRRRSYPPPPVVLLDSVHSTPYVMSGISPIMRPTFARVEGTRGVGHLRGWDGHDKAHCRPRGGFSRFAPRSCPVESPTRSW